MPHSNTCALWLCLLNTLTCSVKELHGCEIYECIHVHSQCSTLCTGGKWLDLKGAKAEQRHNHAGPVAKVMANLAIDGDVNTCSMTKVGTLTHAKTALEHLN